MIMNKFVLLILGIMLYTIPFKAQLITCTPAFPTDQDAVTIIFDAALGNQGLKDFTGHIYAHTGVITNQSNTLSEWKYVIAPWSSNTEKAKMTPLGNNKFQLTIGPSIRQFYNVPPGETIQKLAFVFRNADGSKQGKTATGGDIFYDVYAQAVLAVKIVEPELQPYFVNPGQNFQLKVAASSSTSTVVKINDVVVHTETTSPNDFTHTIIANSSGSHWVKVEANRTGETVKDSMYYVVRESSPVAPLPSGVRDGINYINSTTVTLVLHAPHKNSAYVIGSFNNWQANSAYLMKKTVDSDTDKDMRFWITLSGLTAGKEYLFQYLVDEELKIADPYADKISDPWNDKYIKAETYPDLIAYPEGKTNGIASVMQTAQTPYQWQVTNFTPPKKEDLVIYELLVRDFLANANYQTLIDTIGYFKRLGINAIELMPINEFDGNNSWGYNPAFYFAPDKAYGTKNKLKQFIDICHQNGIAVLLDIVLNHSYGLSPFVRLYFDNDKNKPSAQNPWYNVDHSFRNTAAHWGYDFNHESPYTKALVDSINSYWLTEYKFDGFRFDFTKGFSNTIYGENDWGSAYDASRIAILKRMANEIWKRKPGAFVIFEHLSDNAEEKELADHGIMLWGNMTGPYKEAAMGYNESNKSNLSGTLFSSRNWNQPNLVAYMESHDEERMMYNILNFGKATSYYDTKTKANALKRIELAAAFFYAFPGPKMLWQFGELGYDISINQGGRVDPKPVKWEYYSDLDRLRLYQVLSALIKLKIQHDVFENGTFAMDVAGAYKRINLTGTDMKVTIIGNFDVAGGYVNPGFQQTGAWYDYFAGTSIQVTDVNATIALGPGEYRIFTTVQLPKPNIVTNVTHIKGEIKEIGLKIYPNPSSSKTRISFHMDENIQYSEIGVYDLKGKKISTIHKGFLSKGNHQFDWDLKNTQGQKVSAGMYLLKLNAGGAIGNSIIVVN
jgi:1,4-alpha-glucan branching enzyme